MATKTAFSVLWLISFAAAQTQTPTATIPGLGTVQGIAGQSAWTYRNILKFHNIRYAESPGGNQRFRPPVAVRPWSGIMNASVPGRPCPQVSTTSTSDPNAEDCLSLSVYTGDLSAKRPVMVFIHGGALVSGSAADYGPEYLLEKDIVLVVVQYRLGILGFLSTGTVNIPGNAAMLDVIAALEWVASNIQYFGGDGASVTVFGESAGAQIISALLYSPLVRNGLFNKAILQSGSVFLPWTICQDAANGALDIARYLGCDMTNINSVEDCFRRASVQDLVFAQDEHKKAQFRSAGYANVNGACIVVGDASNFLPNHPKIYLNGALKNITLILGSTSQEGASFLDEFYHYALEPTPLAFDSSWALAQFIAHVNEKFGVITSSNAPLEYQLLNSFTDAQLERVNFNELLPGIVDIFGNLAVKSPILQDANAFAKQYPGRVYLYSFDYVGASNEREFAGFQYNYTDSVFHGDDLKYLFPMSTTLPQADTNMAKMMVDLWTSFATDGIPSGSIWSPMTKPYGPYLQIASLLEKQESYLSEFTASVRKVQISAADSLSATLTSIIASVTIVSYNLL